LAESTVGFAAHGLDASRQMDQIEPPLRQLAEFLRSRPPSLSIDALLTFAKKKP
jgi:hypothetical protein